MSSVSKWFILILIANLQVGCGADFSAKKFLFAGGPFGLPSPLILQAPTGNLLKNADFESGVAAWEDWGFSQALYGDAHSGAGAMRISDQGGCGQEVLHRLKTGATYQLKGFARGSTAASEASLGIRFFDFNNRTLSEIKKTVTSTKWQQFTVSFTVPQRVSSAKVFVWKNSNSSQTADFDDFSLTLTAPPAAPPTLPIIFNPNGYRPMGPSGDWSLVFNDDFDGNILDAFTWNKGFWFQSVLNNELQAYRPENVSLKKGVLTLLAEVRPTTTTWGAPMAYASGAVTTRDKFSFTFGVVEARIKVPKGRGFYPAFWILPDGKRSPPEIDILEILGSTPHTVNFNYHYLDGDGVHSALPGLFTGPDFSADFHIFTLEWAPTHLKYYIDGIERHRFVGDFVLADPGFLILNLAVGGNWPGNPDANTLFPQSYQIDYVRVWQ